MARSVICEPPSEKTKSPTRVTVKVRGSTEYRVLAVWAHVADEARHVAGPAVDRGDVGVGDDAARIGDGGVAAGARVGDEARGLVGAARGERERGEAGKQGAGVHRAQGHDIGARPSSARDPRATSARRGTCNDRAIA
jgi:hypothetical protein